MDFKNCFGKLIRMNNKFQNSLFLLFSIFVVIILIIYGLVFYTYTISQMEETAANNQINTTIKVQEQISMTLNEMDRIAIAVNASNDIVKRLRDIPPNFLDNYFDYNPQINSDIKSVLYSVLSLKNFKARIKLVSRYYDHTGLSTQYDKAITKSEIRSSMNYSQMMKSDTYKFFVPPHDDIWTSYNSNVISLVRPIRNNYGGVFGFVELNLPVSELDSMVKGTNVAILNSDNEIVYSNSKLSTQQWNFIENSDFSNASGTIDSRTVGLIISFSNMKDIDWCVVQFADSKEYDYPMKKIGLIILLTYSLVFIALLVILYWFIRGVTKPIRKLTNIVSNADAQDPNLKLHTKEIQGDIDMLALSFQELIQTVHKSSNELVELKTREMKTQIKAMEAQLNPHFVFNTLSVIGAYGMKAGNDNVHQMCVDLSSMLRYTVDFNLKNATIESEISHVRTYLALMEKRYGTMFEFDIDNHIINQNIVVPKLIIQPLVENCFSHGFNQVESPWRVSIKLYTVGSEWRVRIKDNGVGFTKEQIDEITEMQKKNDFFKEKSGIGMTNTFLRLHHYYGGEEHIDFYSDHGAVIEIGGSINYGKY